MTGRPVDLVDPRDAGIPVAYMALTSGRVLFSRDTNLYPTLLARALIDAADFLLIHERILRERRAAWLD